MYGTLFLYMVTAVRLLYAQKWKGLTVPTAEDWLLKVGELAEMAKLMSLIREKSIARFLFDW